MDVATMTMPVNEARAKYELYRDCLAGRPITTEDRGILIGYKAMVKGRAVLHLGDVFRACPFDDKGRPKLAIARAHWQWCFFRSKNRFARNDLLAFAGSERDTWGDGRQRKILLPRPSDRRVQVTDNLCRAVVPIIPPNLRPAPERIHEYHILWEAEWETVPTDPLLLRHLHGSLYAVFAAWDLTPLEKAVLSDRLTETR